jgi:hypothetical protein
MTDKTETCSICGGPIDVQGTWTKGHNAKPVTAGRCCTECNITVVIPQRIALINPRKESEL